ncbi:glycoside hydrolase family 43 protein [Natronolimnobius sp. AArcel1]|uniref:glycoside hydrolase family 43 protein n=1 Tax=Natronolimnobius sp. AArcel1 TaxID=1679093 RepID=UPI0013EC99EC|nr:glycoside hydrolase family 43 protein [Natronolimnobius sp. AArcel1]NGM69136.1 glycoside hydrolase family 43 protein [Natronolimnobius sp. AArcel1]
MRYKNPVLPGFHPDPTICRADGSFFLATSSFEYVPGVPLYRSDNLADWEPIGHALTRDSQFAAHHADALTGIYAPTLRHHDGTFYLVTTNVSGGGHFFVTAEDPAGEWSEPTWIDAPGIDPDLFFEDGTCYFTYHSDDPDAPIQQAELDLETGDLGESSTIWTGFRDPYVEAPHIYERDGTYYLMVAEGGTHAGHMVVMARADDPTGPYEGCPDNPILTHWGQPRDAIRAVGHADLVQDHNGAWWLVCLGIRQRGPWPRYHHLGRETFLAPVSWENGWPVVNDGEPIQAAMDAPLPGDRKTDETSIDRTDTTFADGLGLEWQFRRNPDRERYETGSDGLRLRGGPESLAEPGATFVGRRQTAFDCRLEAALSFDPGAGEEAGIAVVADERHHYQVGVTRREGRREAIVRLRIGDATEIVGRTPVGETVDLSVVADAESYRFLVDGTELGSGSTRYLSTEVADGFTGVVVGPYATGHGTTCETDAVIERVVYSTD